MMMSSFPWLYKSCIIVIHSVCQLLHFEHWLLHLATRMAEPAPPVPAVVYTATIGTIAPFQPETDPGKSGVVHGSQQLSRREEGARSSQHHGRAYL